MRYTALIVALIGFLLLLAFYGAVTVIYSRVSRSGLPRRYYSDDPSTSSNQVYGSYGSIELPCRARVTGGHQKTGTLIWGFLKLPVSHRINVGWLLMFLASVGGVALGAYVWRELP